MKIGDYDITLSPLGWAALAAGVAAAAIGPGKGFREDLNMWALHVYLVPPDGEQVQIEHIFYGDTKEDARALFEQHQEVCDSFGPAVADGRTAEEWEPDPDVPELE